MTRGEASGVAKMPSSDSGGECVSDGEGGGRSGTEREGFGGRRVDDLSIASDGDEERVYDEQEV